MKKLYCLLAFSLLITTLGAAESFKGYIVTLNGKRLTGYISTIFHSDYGSEIVFINDFGTPYNIHPALIRGFSFEKNTDRVFYESKYHHRKWLFLKVMYKGDGMNLYQAPEEKTTLSQFGSVLTQESRKNIEYWIETRVRGLVPLPRVGFKSRFRKIFRKTAPELAAKIGTPGYRFKDVLRIVEEYNKIVSIEQWRL